MRNNKEYSQMHSLLVPLESAKQVGTLYHYTSFFNLLSILEKNKLQQGPTGYVSFTRNRHLHWQSLVAIKTDTRIEIDGDKLSERYALKPYKYHGLDVEVPYESEERTVRTIKPFKQYIKNITLFKDRWPGKEDRNWPKFEILLSRYLGIDNVSFENYVRYVNHFNVPISLKHVKGERQ